MSEEDAACCSSASLVTSVLPQEAAACWFSLSPICVLPPFSSSVESSNPCKDSESQLTGGPFTPAMGMPADELLCCNKQLCPLGGSPKPCAKRRMCVSVEDEEYLRRLHLRRLPMALPHADGRDRPTQACREYANTTQTMYMDSRNNKTNTLLKPIPAPAIKHRSVI